MAIVTSEYATAAFHTRGRQIVSATFHKLLHTDEAMVLAAAIGVACRTIVGDAFFWFFLLLFASNVADWVSGRLVARSQRTFSNTRSREGLYGKAIGLTIIMLIRTLEALLIKLGIPSTNGYIAIAITCALIYEDIESLERHAVALGHNRIPILSTALKHLRSITGGERRFPPSPPGQRRTEDKSDEPSKPS